MTDRDTIMRILSDKSLPIHRHYKGVYNRKDILELYLMGYITHEVCEELGLNKSVVVNSTKRLRSHLGYETKAIMLRELVKKHRGYL